MDAYLLDWVNLLLRWAHVITAIAWIGSSFYFVFLDNSLLKPQDHTLVMIDFQSQMAFATKSIAPELLRNNAALVAGERTHAVGDDKDLREGEGDALAQLVAKHRFEPLPLGHQVREFE